MKLELTKDQYYQLLRLAYIGDWLANAHAVAGELPGEDTEISDIFNYILKHAPEAGHADMISDKTGDIYPSDKLGFDKSIRQLIDNYNTESMFEELAEALAHRDMATKLNREQKRKLKPEELWNKFYELEYAWLDEFEKRGVDRLKIGGGR
jgi:hypothetical protein